MTQKGDDQIVKNPDFTETSEIICFRNTIEKLLSFLGEMPPDLSDLSDLTQVDLETKANFVRSSLEDLYDKYISFMILRKKFDFASDLQISSIKVINDLIDLSIVLLMQERLSSVTRRELSNTLFFIKTEDQLSGLRFISHEITLPEFSEEDTLHKDPVDQNYLRDSLVIDDNHDKFMLVEKESNFCNTIRKLENFNTLLHTKFKKNNQSSIQNENDLSNERSSRRRLIIAWGVVLPLYILSMIHLISEYA